MIFESGELAETIQNNDFLSKYIPGFSLATDNNIEASVEFLNQEVFFEFKDYPKIKIGIKGVSEKEIISLIELVFERVRQEKGIFCIHSATAVYKGKAVIFWGGASGMGKTRLAKLLANDGSFYSDEKTLVNARNMEILGGIPFIYLDKDYWKRQITDKQEDSYYHSATNNSEPVPIALFVYGFGINGAEMSTDLWRPEKFEWHLYEELGRKIRAISRRVKDGNIAVPSIDSRANGDHRIQSVKEVAQKIPCYSIQGSPESVVDYIKQLEIWK